MRRPQHLPSCLPQLTPLWPHVPAASSCVFFKDKTLIKLCECLMMSRKTVTAVSFERGKCIADDCNQVVNKIFHL